MTEQRRRIVSWIGVIAVLAIGLLVAPAAAQQAPRPAEIDRNGTLVLVRSALMALDHANKTGNYTVLRDLGAPGFQINSAARLAEVFAAIRNVKLDLSATTVTEPEFSVPPQIESNGLMRMAGSFPAASPQVNFEMLFAAVENQWRLFGISVTPGAAPPPSPAPAVATAKQKRSAETNVSPGVLKPALR